MKGKEKEGVETRKSYADVLRKGISESISTPMVKVEEEEVEWLTSAVAMVRDVRSVESVRECFYSEGFYDVEVRELGGKRMLLTFESVDIMEVLLKDYSNWLQNWFEQVV